MESTLDNVRFTDIFAFAGYRSCAPSVQAHVELDEIFFAEDICCNHGLLISPDFLRRFLFPAYAALLKAAQKGNHGESRSRSIPMAIAVPPFPFIANWV